MPKPRQFRLTGDGPRTLALVDVQRLCTDPDYCPPTRKQLVAARYRDWLESKKPPGFKAGGKSP